MTPQSPHREDGPPAGEAPQTGDPSPGEANVIERIERQRAQQERAAREPVSSLWRTVAQVGTLGWLIALPPVAGAFFGHLLDMRAGGGITWALALMFLGLALGGYFFWRAIDEAQGGGR